MTFATLDWQDFIYLKVRWEEKGGGGFTKKGDAGRRMGGV